MKPCRLPGSWPHFLCQPYVVVIVVILLNGIPVHEVSGLTISTPSEGHQCHNNVLVERPYRPPSHCQSPLPHQKDHISVVREETRKPQPVFFPYTVPIPWPTPFDGSRYAPVPTASRTVTSLTSEPLKNDSYPVYVPVPQFEYVPFYYNGPCASKTVNPVFASKLTSTVHLPRKPTPVPTLTECSSTQVPVKQPTAKLPQQKCVSIPNESSSIPVKQLPTESENCLDPIREDLPPQKPILPPPKHNWVPPPDKLPEVPSSPSILHPRSFTSHYKKANDYITYDPLYYTVTDDGHDMTFSPETFTYDHSDNPYGLDPYYHKPPKQSNLLSDRSSFNELPYVTYDSEKVSIVDPTEEGEMGYITYGPGVNTYTEESLVPQPSIHSRPRYYESPHRIIRPRPRPTPPLHIGSRSSIPTKPQDKKWISYGPSVYTIQGDSDNSKPPAEQIGSRSSYTPKSKVKEQTGWIYYGPSVYTVQDDSNDTHDIPPYSLRPPPPPRIGGRSSFIPTPQKKEEDIGWVYYGPSTYTVADDHRDVLYDTDVVTVTAPVKEHHSGEHTKDKHVVRHVEQPLNFHFSDPEGNFLQNYK